MKLLIIGLRKKETSRIKAPKGVDINYVFSDNINSKLLQNIDKFNFVINLCKFSKHSVEYMCNNHEGFIRLRPTQGISTVNNLLGVLANG